MSDDKKSLLPINASDLLFDLEKTGSQILELETKNRYVLNPDLAPINILPWLGWGFSVDDWNDEWDTDVKRAIIKSSIKLHRKKGTIGALKEALSAFNFVDIKIEEWFDYGGDPYVFRVFFSITYSGFDINILSDIKKVIQNTKNARSYLESFKPYLSSKPAEVKLGAFIISKELVTLPAAIDDQDNFLTNQSSVPILGAFFISKEITTIYPI